MKNGVSDLGRVGSEEKCKAVVVKKKRERELSVIEGKKKKKKNGALF